MRVWGAILDPHRDLGPIGVAISTIHVIDAFRLSPYGLKV